jgi:ABC-type oligopeptide transport system substrate-binding subunit
MDARVQKQKGQNFIWLVFWQPVCSLTGDLTLMGASFVEKARSMKRLYFLVLLGSFVLLFVSPACAEDGLIAVSPRHGIAMHGEPKYGDSFTHFDYVNPDAPEGGALRLGVVGTFDSLNPFIVRGQPPQAPGFALQGAVYESLMARSWDEPFSLYGLIAESIEVPADRSSITFTLRPEARWQDGWPLTAEKWRKRKNLVPERRVSRSRATTMASWTAKCRLSWG